MSNIDKRAQKELYAKVEQQAHSLRGNPREYQALTGMCPVNVIEMHAQKIQALLDELEAKDRRIEEEIGRANREHHRGFMMACGHLKEHSNVHYADAAEMEIAALRKRINELESAAAGKGD